jgi:hypothetical protein
MRVIPAFMPAEVRPMPRDAGLIECELKRAQFWACAGGSHDHQSRHETMNVWLCKEAV